MLVFAFRSEIWIMHNFNFTIFEDFCLSLSWKYRVLQNVNQAKVQSKINKYCKFHIDLTRSRLSKSRFKKLGMVPKKLYRNTLIHIRLSIDKEKPHLHLQLTHIYIRVYNTRFVNKPGQLVAIVCFEFQTTLYNIARRITLVSRQP